MKKTKIEPNIFFVNAVRGDAPYNTRTIGWRLHNYDGEMYRGPFLAPLKEQVLQQYPNAKFVGG